MPLKDKTYYELYADLLRAYRLACRHKGATNNRLRFELRREELLSELTASILRREYVPAPSTRFIVTEPVTREVIAANFRERVVHHYIDEYLSPYLERILIYDCYSCRKYKGISAGVERLEHHIRSCSQNYTKPCYVLKLDIRSYFMSISRDILYAKAQRLLRWIGRQTDPQTGRRNDATDRFRIVSYLTGQVIHCDPLDGCVYRGDPKLLGRLPASKSLARSPEGCGLPIGNLTSQLFSNLYLNDFDHYMKERLGLKHYGRYVDDFYIVHNDLGYLLSLIPAIGRFLRDDAALSLHPDKTKLANVLGGIAFLGSYIKPYRRYVLHRTVFRIREKLDRLDRRGISPSRGVCGVRSRRPIPFWGLLSAPVPTGSGRRCSGAASCSATAMLRPYCGNWCSTAVGRRCASSTPTDGWKMSSSKRTEKTTDESAQHPEKNEDHDQQKISEPAG